MYGFLGHLVVHPQKDKILTYPLFILLSGPRMGGGGVTSNSNKWSGRRRKSFE